MNILLDNGKSVNPDDFTKMIESHEALIKMLEEMRLKSKLILIGQENITLADHWEELVKRYAHKNNRRKVMLSEMIIRYNSSINNLSI